MKIGLQITGLITLLILITSGTSEGQHLDESLRPQVHYSPAVDSLEQTYGLVNIEDEYHVFYQHFPINDETSQMKWGQAVSTDLIHWKEINEAPIPIETDTECSAAVIVDNANKSGLKSGDIAPIIFFTLNEDGDFSITYSNDKGRNWEKYDSPINIELPHFAYDPNIFWHEASNKYILTIWTQDDNEENEGISFFSSPNLIDWAFESHLNGIVNTPANLIEIPLSDESTSKWVLFDSSGSYQIGNFDGEKFVSETELMDYDLGVNFYGSQICIDQENGRIIQISSLLGGNYPDMPFSGQLTFPTVLTLTSTADGVRIKKTPIEEIKELHEKNGSFYKNESQYPGLNKNLTKKVKGDCLHIVGTFDLKTVNNFGFVARSTKSGEGAEIYFDATKNTIHCMGNKAPLEPADGKIKLEIIIDRASVEVFANDGLISFSCYLEADPKADRLILFNNGGELLVEDLEIYNLKSIYSTE